MNLVSLLVRFLHFYPSCVCLLKHVGFILRWPYFFVPIYRFFSLTRVTGCNIRWWRWNAKLNVAGGPAHNISMGDWRTVWPTPLAAESQFRATKSCFYFYFYEQIVDNVSSDKNLKASTSVGPPIRPNLTFCGQECTLTEHRTTWTSFCCLSERCTNISCRCLWEIRKMLPRAINQPPWVCARQSSF